RAARQRLDRQRWLSRLLVATPRLLAAAEYARIRRQIEPTGGVVAGDKGRNKGRNEIGQPVVVQVGQGDVVMGAPEQRVQEPIVPIGFVSGATPRPGTVVAVPQIADEQTSTAVMETRGRRRMKDDIADGFDDLAAPVDEE